MLKSHCFVRGGRVATLLCTGFVLVGLHACKTDQAAEVAAPVARAASAPDLCPAPKELPKGCPWAPTHEARVFGGPPKTCVDRNCPAFEIEIGEIDIPEHGPRCTATLPYGKLTYKHVNVKDEERRQVTWKLNTTDAGAGYSFAASGPGISLSERTDGHSKEPGKYWAVTTSKSGTEVTAVRHYLHDSYKTSKFCHYARVFRKREGQPDQLCCPLDPMIINEPS